MRTVPFWVITKRVVVITYRRFGKPFLTPEIGPDRLSRNVDKKCNTARCAITQNSAVLVVQLPEYQHLLTRRRAQTLTGMIH